MPSKPAIHAHVSDAAHDSWHDFAAASGVSVSAMIEALAPSLNGAGHLTLGEVVVAARKIDAARRRSRGRKKKS